MYDVYVKPQKNSINEKFEWVFYKSCRTLKDANCFAILLQECTGVRTKIKVGA